MKKFEKVYVGKGHNPHADLEITRITVRIDELQKLAYELKGNKLVTLEVARLKEADQFGRTHTVYGSVLKEEDKPAPGKKTRK